MQISHRLKVRNQQSENELGPSIGIIAGTGDLPVIIARDAKERGFKVITVAIESLASFELNDVSDEIKWVNVGKLGELINTLKSYGIREAIMAGKVPKTIIYRSKVIPDLRAIKLFFSLKDKNDDTILNAITKELKEEGISIVDTATFSPHLLTPEGNLTKIPLTKDELEDVEFGYRIAKEIGRLDIGQTVVIKDKAVMAVEAIEGTDEAIIRGGNLAGEGSVVIKISKPQQDMRLDVPAVGIETLKSMIRVKARVLAIEANRSIMINKEELIKKAEEAGISIIGYSNTTS